MGSTVGPFGSSDICSCSFASEGRWAGRSTAVEKGGFKVSRVILRL